jgi:DNA polymerase I-like protein with 3'-5' exonuclease and polymerase domains
MVDIDKLLQGTNAKMLVQVHDELVVALPYEDLDGLIEPFLTAMGNDRVINGVPLKVSYHNAINWAEAKG